jgi:FKBP-type peptidyl-prolyl cis-trans isomerase
MKNISYYFLLILLVTSCAEQIEETPTAIKEKVNPRSTKKITKIDRQIIREYVGLQTDMNFDSTDSGIFYVLENLGIGDPPTDTSMVTVHYALYLVDGTEIENTFEKNKPSTFQVGKVIPGWKESLKLLGVLGKGTFVIPSGLGYGMQSVNGMPRNAILVFDIEILEIDG